MSSPAASPPPGAYWDGMHGDGPDSAGALLKAVREFRGTDASMRRRTQAALAINETDLLAIRHLIRAERAGELIGPTELSAHLGITSAATAKLLSRLAGSGHISREPHAVDRRAQVVRVTPRAHREVKRALGAVHQRMLDVADELSVADRRTVIRFLRELGAAMTPVESSSPARPY